MDGVHIREAVAIGVEDFHCAAVGTAPVTVWAVDEYDAFAHAIVIKVYARDLVAGGCGGSGAFEVVGHGGFELGGGWVVFGCG